METKTVKAELNNCSIAGEALKEGKIVAFPTDTVYGLGAIYTDRAAVRRIFEAKGRDEGKPLSVLISDISQVRLLAKNISGDARVLMDKFWPGPLTMIFEKNDTVPSEVSAGGNTVGVRMPENAVARALIEAAGAPLAAPSANTSGKRSASSAREVLEDLDGRIDLVMDAGSAGSGISSTVIDMTRTPYSIVRPGDITQEMIDAALSAGPENARTGAVAVGSKIRNIIFADEDDTEMAPFAAELLKKKLWARQLYSYCIESCGAIVLFSEPVNPKIAEAAWSFGVSLSEHRAKEADTALFSDDSLILCMDNPSKSRILKKCHGAANVYTLKEYLGEKGDVYLPLGGTMEQYEAACGAVDRLLEALTDIIAKEVQNNDSVRQ